MLRRNFVAVAHFFSQQWPVSQFHTSWYHNDTAQCEFSTPPNRLTSSWSISSFPTQKCGDLVDDRSNEMLETGSVAPATISNSQSKLLGRWEIFKLNFERLNAGIIRKRRSNQFFKLHGKSIQSISFKRIKGINGSCETVDWPRTNQRI